MDIKSSVLKYPSTLVDFRLPLPVHQIHRLHQLFDPPMVVQQIGAFGMSKRFKMVANNRCLQDFR